MDPGQIVCLWAKCLSLARFFESFDRKFSNVKIHLKDTESANWSANGTPQKSVTVRRIWSDPPRASVTHWLNQQTNTFLEDYRIVLTAFYRSCNVRNARVYLPENMACDDKIAYVAVMELALMLKDSTGALLDVKDPWCLENLQKSQDQLFMDLDRELDLLPGTTANMMRLERFSSWYSDGFGSNSSL